MKLRRLELKDAPLMLEWMHDDSVVHDLNCNFLGKTIYDCENFIEENQNSDANLHLAIVDDDDNYMGTVSLKHIDKFEKTAEFAITLRKCAMGKGYSNFGMQEIIKIAFEEMLLNQVYFCVSKNNARAIRFYEKMGYKEVDEVTDKMTEHYDSTMVMELKWHIIEQA